MNQFQRILVVVQSDFLSANSVNEMPIELQKALQLASDKKLTELHLVCVAYEKHLDQDYLSLDFDLIQRRQEYCNRLTNNLDKLSGKIESEGYQCQGEVIWARPSYQTVVSMASELAVDLVIQHTRSYGKLEFHHLTNDAWQLIRHCPVPLLLVKNNPWHSSTTMIAAIDPMHSHHKPLALDNSIMDVAIEVRDQLSGELHIVHAYAAAVRPFAPAGVIETAHRKCFDEFVSEYDIPSEQLHFLDETPIAAIQKINDKLNADILIMGAISRSRLSEALVGSTAEKVLDFLDLDTLIVNPNPSQATLE